MSIINKMLQDLEQRHASGAAGNMPGQVRAAPDERSIHIAWIMVGLLTALLCALLLWLWLRPLPPAKPVHVGAPPLLALKIAPDLTDLPKVAPKAAVVTDVVPTSAVIATVVPTRAADTASDQAIVDETKAKRESREDHVKPASTPLQSNRTLAAKELRAARAATSSAAEVSNSAAERMADAPATFNKQIKELTPQQRAENDYRKATGLAQQGHVQEAITLLQQVLQSDAQNAGARQALISLLVNSKRQDEAARYAQDGLTLDPKQTGFAMILARLQVDQGQQQQAIATLQRSLPYAQERPDYQAFLAALLQREGRHKEAITQYLLALRKTPQNGVWWMGLGISMQADNRAEEAREAFSRAKETNTLSPELQAFVQQKLKQLSH